MTLNLGQTLRDAVDGPSLDDLVGEDPADVDLPALSARIRRRRRTRVATRSAVGVAAAGAVALAGIHGGLDRRGVEMPGGPQVGPLTGPPPQPLAPLSAAQLSAVTAQLCGKDVSAMPAVDGARLAPMDVATTVHQTNLGTLAGRTLAAAVVTGAGADASAPGQIVLTTGAGTIVAIGAPQPDPGNSLFEVLPTGRATGISPVAVRLTPCASPAGTPESLPAGTYQVQYLVSTYPSGAQEGMRGTARSAAGPWSVTLLDQQAFGVSLPDGVPNALPDGFPALEVPVVNGLYGASGRCPAAPDGWTVAVSVMGDDAITRAADALRAAGAGIGEQNAPVDRCTTQGQSGSSDGGLASLQATMAALQKGLATKQAQLGQVQADVAAAQQEQEALVASAADPQQQLAATIRVQQSQTDLQTLTAEVQQQQTLITSQSALIAEALATGGSAAEHGVAADSYRAQVVSNGGGSYTVYGPRQFTARTKSWTVRVEESADGTVLTYSVLPR